MIVGLGVGLGKYGVQLQPTLSFIISPCQLTFSIKEYYGLKAQVSNAGGKIIISLFWWMTSRFSLYALMRVVLTQKISIHTNIGQKINHKSTTF